MAADRESAPSWQGIASNKGEYSFSTCWNIKRHTTGSAMIDEIRSLGFQRVELNYNVTPELLSTIEPMIEHGDIGVSSVHNTFPFIADPDYGTDSVLLGFKDEAKRKRAIDLLFNLRNTLIVMGRRQLLYIRAKSRSTTTLMKN